MVICYTVKNECVLSLFSVTFLIEVACNKVLGEGQGHFIGPPDENVTYTLNKCNLTIRNKYVYRLLMDLKMLHDIAKVRVTLFCVFNICP